MSLHIGKLIEKRLEYVGMSKSEFARRINRARQNVNDILNRQSIDTELLASISRALRYDFFQVYMEQLKDEADMERPDGELAEMLGRLHEMEKEQLSLKLKLESAQREIELLRDLKASYEKQLRDD